MKRLFIFSILALLLASGVAYAEMSAQAYSYAVDARTEDYQVSIIAINDTGATIPAGSKSVVIVDTDKITTSGIASKQVACYFASSTTPGDARFVGVTDNDTDVLNGEMVKLIVRGAALVDMLASHTVTRTAGATICVSNVALHADDVANALVRAGIQGTPGQPYRAVGTYLAPQVDSDNTGGYGPEGFIDASTKTVRQWVWLY